jgi:hypothetical protein
LGKYKILKGIYVMEPVATVPKICWELSAT